MQKYLFFPVILFSCISGCVWEGSLADRTLRSADRLSFGQTGATIFSSPAQHSLKEVHLETASLIGREVVLEGEIVSTNEHDTYMVIKDESARMLVVLANMTDGPVRVPVAAKVRILGTVESGKRGMPYLLAKAVARARPS